MEKIMTRHIARSVTDTPKDTWGTDQKIFNSLHSILKFNYDLAASDFNCKLKKFFTKEMNALNQDWSNLGTCWLNPPFSELKNMKWFDKIKKTMYDTPNTNFSLAMLLPVATDTKWFQDGVFDRADCLWFPRGRLNFENHDRVLMKGVPFPSCVAFYNFSYIPKHVITGELNGCFVSLNDDN